MHVVRPFGRLSLALLVLIAAFLTGCSTKSDLHKTLRSNAVSPATGGPTILAAYQPWFGRSGHIDVGYSTQDRVVLARQIQDAQNLGISAFVVNWYGPSKDFEDRSYALMQGIAARSNFKVALMYDEHVDDPQRGTEVAIQDLQYAYDRYFGPAAANREAYLRFNDKPVIFIFPKDGNTDWKRVREAMSAWNEQPILIYKDANRRYADQFDGFYAWVHPGNDGWSRDGSNWGRAYLENFYRTMQSEFGGKIAVGAAWPGFDDSRASWTRNRKMDARCGKTFDDTFRVFRRFYGGSRPQLPFLMIVTWNDYEEGTAIERGVAHCALHRQGMRPREYAPDDPVPKASSRPT